jgi:hypothetical protein
VGKLYSLRLEAVASYAAARALFHQHAAWRFEKVYIECRFQKQRYEEKHTNAALLAFFAIAACSVPRTKTSTSQTRTPRAVLTKTEPFILTHLWIATWPKLGGRYIPHFSRQVRRRPLWGEARDLQVANGRNADEAFHRKAEEFQEPIMPANVPVGTPGLHGAVWSKRCTRMRRIKAQDLVCLYHNENYPSTCPTIPQPALVIKTACGPRA